LWPSGFNEKRKNIFKVLEFENQFSKYMGCPYALGVSSGSAAVRVAVAALGIKRGDEVITQSFTFVATVEAIIEAGATPIIAEVDDTLNLDPEDLKKKGYTLLAAVMKMDDDIRQVKALGIPCGQVGFAGHVALGADVAEAWREAAEAEQLVARFSARYDWILASSL
jgi:threonine aldolase